MRRLRSLVLALATILLAFVAVGCTSSRAQSDSKTIVFWNPFTGPDGTSMQKLVNEYNATKPEYPVKNISLAEGDMYAKIPTIVNSGRGIPDLTIVHVERIKDYVHNGILDTYDQYLSNYPNIKSSNYVQEAWNDGSYEGHRYGIPLDIHTYVLYYNKDLVAKYCPKALDDNIVTFDEIKAAGEKAKKDGITALGLTWWKPTYLSMLAQQGGELTKNGVDPTLNTEPAKNTLNFYKSLYASGITSRNGQDAMQLFLTGKEIFYPDGTWMVNQIRESKIKFGLTNAPQVSADPKKMVNWSSSHQFVLLKQAKRNTAKTKATLKFINWVRTHSIYWAESGQNPASQAITKNKAYQKMGQSFLLKSKTEQESLRIFDYRYNGYVADFLDQYALDPVFGKTSSEKYLKDMQSTVQDKIDAQITD